MRTPGLNSHCMPSQSPKVGAEPTGKIAVHKEPLCAEKNRHRESGTLIVLREKTKQVLMNSGPNSGGVARQHLRGEKLFNVITRKVGDETLSRDALQKAPSKPALGWRRGRPQPRYSFLGVSAVKNQPAHAGDPGLGAPAHTVSYSRTEHMPM